MFAEEQALGLLRGQVAAILLGSVFGVVGLSAWAVAALGRPVAARLLTWFGVFSTMYGVRLLLESPAVALLPAWAQPHVAHLTWAITYFIIVPATLFWVEMSRGGLRLWLQAVVVAGAAIGLAGVLTHLAGGPADRFMRPNNLLATAMMLSLAAVSLTPALARRLLPLHTRVLTLGLLVALAAGLYTNLSGVLGYEPAGVEPLAFTFFLSSLGYATVRHLVRAERQLLSVERELEIARQIQTSILPTSVPHLPRLRIDAAYHPMTAVAGDFYEFIPAGEGRAGFLIADVSGHGVAAALVASMVKAAVLSLSARADDPGALLRELNRMFTDRLRSRLITASYLYLDLEASRALYSAAGHPPLLHWDSGEGQVQSVESNGLLLGVAADALYPVRELPLRPGDRFVLYTDGLSEAECGTDEAFGDRRLPGLIRTHCRSPAPELSRHILEELRRCRPADASQQDDITWIVVEVL